MAGPHMVKDLLRLGLKVELRIGFSFRLRGLVSRLGEGTESHITVLTRIEVEG